MSWSFSEPPSPQKSIPGARLALLRWLSSLRKPKKSHKSAANPLTRTHNTLDLSAPANPTHRLSVVHLIPQSICTR